MPDDVPTKSDFLVSELNASEDFEFGLKPENGEACGAGEEPNKNMPFDGAVSVDSAFSFVFLSD